MNLTLIATALALLGGLGIRSGIQAWRGTDTGRNRLLPTNSLVWMVPVGVGTILVGVAGIVSQVFGRPPAQVVAYIALVPGAIGVYILFVNPKWARPPYARPRKQNRPQ